MVRASRVPADKPARLIIVDDHNLTRAGLRETLHDEPSIEVVGEASNGRQALALCAQMQPDLVLMDVRMPEMDGLKATRAIKRNHPEISILMLSIHDNPDYLLEALKAGAAGYVLKEADGDELISAVQQVLTGGSPLDSDLAASVLRQLAVDLMRGRGAGGASSSGLAERGRPPTLPTPIDPLTPREVEVLGLVAQGQTNREIARTLVISAGTAKNHVEHIIAKMGVSDRTQAAVWAYELGIITPSG